MTWREWLGLAAGLLALGAAFLPWTTLSTTRPDIADVLNSLPQGDVVRTAWNSGFFAWFPPLPLLPAGLAVALFGRIPKVRVSGLPHLWLVVAVASLLFIVVGWLVMDWQFDEDQRGLFDAAGIVIGSGVGRYLATLAAVVSAVAAFLDVRVLRAESREPRKRAGRTSKR